MCADDGSRKNFEDKGQKPSKQNHQNSSFAKTTLFLLIGLCIVQQAILMKKLTVSYETVLHSEKLSFSPIPKPLNADVGFFLREDLPFMVTLAETYNKPRDPDDPVVKNFYDLLSENGCLPNSRMCNTCLRYDEGITCESCAWACSCYCSELCQTPIEEKPVSKTVLVRAPFHNRNEDRLIPRIIHQTWFEEITPDKYPNMSRFLESFKHSGWEYRFYTDEDCIKFLSTHFPPEIKEAYEAVKPGAFKADLFRYCVLLVHGGVYADLDVMLEANLDFAIPEDVGFMVPLDEPGELVDHQMCLWNGFMASAPGHPFLAKTIETVVNNIRNRFTGVDFDAMFCPQPDLGLLHRKEILLPTGPCIIGAVINLMVKRHAQTSFDHGTNKFSTAFFGEDYPEVQIPGRTVMLKQNKFDVSK